MSAPPPPNRTAAAIGNPHVVVTSPFALIERKDQGVYYTPAALADFVVELTLGPILARADSVRDLRGLAILDPAVGGGAFLIAAVRTLRRRLHDLMPSTAERRVNATLNSIVREGFYGLDVDPLSARGADLAVRLECIGPTEGASEPFCRIVAADALSEEIEHFARRWDAIFCNPPWGKLKPNVREYYSALDPDARDLQGAELRNYVRLRHARSAEDYARYVQEILLRAKTLRASPAIGLRKHANGRKTGGDAEYYRFFMERIHAWSSGGTRVGLIVPIAFLNSEGAAGLRRAFLQAGTFEQLLSFENRQRLFPIHGMYRFTVSIYERGRAHGVRNSIVGLRGVDEAKTAITRRVSLSCSYLREISPFYGLVPIVGTFEDRALLRRIRSAHPGLRESASEWHAHFERECDMTQDARLFIHATDVQVDARLSDGSVRARGERLLPVYEGRLVGQFDSRAKAYVAGNGRLARWLPLATSEKKLAPHFYMHERDAEALTGTSHFGVRAAYCDIGGHANERTLVAALIPSGAICGNKVPTVRFASGDARLPRLWVGVANSFAVDWVARRLVSTTINYFYWHDIPMPFIEPGSADGIFVASAVAKLHAKNVGRPTHRAALRAALDAYVAHRFGLIQRDLERIFADFPLVDAGDKRRPTLSLVGHGLAELQRGKSLAELLQALEQLAGCQTSLA